MALGFEELNIKITSESQSAADGISNLIAQLERLNSVNLNKFYSNFKHVVNLPTQFEEESDKMAQNIARSFRLTGAAFDSFSRDLASAMKAVQGGGYDYDAIDRATTVLRKEGSVIEGSTDSWKRLREYVTKSAGAISSASVSVSEFADDAQKVTAVLGKGWSFSSGSGIDIGEWVSEMDSVLGTNFWERSGEQAGAALRLVVEELEHGREAVRSFAKDADYMEQNFGSAAEVVKNSVGDMFQRIVENPSLGAGRQTTFNPFADSMRAIADSARSFSPSLIDGISNAFERLNNISSKSNFAALAEKIVPFITVMNGIQFNPESLRGFATLGTALTGLSKAKIPAGLFDSLQVFIEKTNGLEPNVEIIAALRYLAETLTMFASKTGNRYEESFTSLANGLERLFQVLARAPNISENSVRALEAIGKLDAESVKASRGFARMSESANKGAASVRNYADHTHRSASSTQSLTSRLAFAIGKFRQIYFVIRRIGRLFSKMVTSAMDYVETLNYFNAAFDQVASRSEEIFGQAGQEAGSAFANRFAEEAAKLTEKMSGYSVTSSGMVTNTMGKTLGMNPASMMNYQATFAQMASSMGVSSEMATDLSRALTEIGADLASVKNLGFEDTWKNLQSGLVGMSRAVDKYGLNIRNVNLQQKLTQLGIEANIQSMNQQDKALLRTIIILENSQYAWGDLADTLQQPANQIRMLKSGVANLGRTIGNLLLPIVAAALPYINAFVVALQKMVELLVTAIGYEFDWGSAGGAAIDSEWADYMDETADSFGNATEAAKEWQNQILGFDEINKLGSESSDDSDSGASNALITGQLEDALRAALDAYQRVWDASYANVNNRVNEMAQAIVDAFQEGDFFAIGQKISGWIVDGLTKVDWDRVKSFAYSVGTEFANFLNGFISPELFATAGRTIAEALNTAVQRALGFGKHFDWTNFGESIGTGISEFLITFNFGELVNAFDAFVQGFAKAIIGALGKIRWGEIFSNVINGLLELDPVTIALVVGSIGIKAAAGAAAGLLKQLVSGLASMFMFSPGFGIALAGGALVLSVALNLSIEKLRIDELVRQTMPAVTALDDIARSLNDAVTAADKLASNAAFKGEWLQDVADEYNKLNEKVSLTREEEDRLRELADILAKENPAFLELIDSQTGKWKGTYDQLDQLVRKTREYYLTMAAEEAKSGYYSTAMEADIGLRAAVRERDAEQKQYEELTRQYTALTQARARADKDYDPTKDSEAIKIANDMATALSKVQAANKRIAEFQEQLNDANAAMAKYDEYINEMILQTKGLSDAVIEATREINDASFTEWVDQAVKDIDKVGGYWVQGTNGMVQVTGEASLRIYQAMMNGDLKKIGPGMYQTAMGDVIYYGNGLTAGQKSTQFVSAVNTFGKYGPGAMRAFYSDWQQAGTQSANYTASGFKKGIAAQMNSVKASGRSMAHAGFLKGFDEAMLIESPSKAMQQRGVYIVQGLANGLSNTKPLINPLNNLFNTITGIFNYNNVRTGLGGVVTAFNNAFGDAANAALNQYNAMASNMNTATVNKNRAVNFSKVPLLKYANGGFPEDGFFFANSTEMVGRFANGRTAVANNEQIIQGIEGGVARGMAQAIMSTANATGGTNGQPVQVVISVDSETLYRATLRGESKYNNRYHMTVR